MTLYRRILLMTFIESFATIIVERGIYFYARHRLQFTDTDNLILALGFGLAMAAGAFASHAVSRKFGERRVVVGAIITIAMLHGVLTQWNGAAAIYIGTGLLALLHGLKWPVIESYIGAGRDLKDAAKTVGRFSLSWASAVPMAIAAAGYLSARGGAWLFIAAGVFNLGSISLALTMPPKPAHWDDDHPERPAPELLAKLRAQLGAGRTLMWCSYAALYVLAAITPRILGDLGLSVTVAATIACIIDISRGSAFWLFQVWEGWHGRRIGLVIAMLCLPIGFVMVVVGYSVITVIVGEVIFGLAAGLIYYASLYYALLIRNAAVDAGGVHEGLIGLGFAAGPLLALAGASAASHVGGTSMSYLIAVGVLFGVCAIAATARLARSPGGKV